MVGWGEGGGRGAGQSFIGSIGDERRYSGCRDQFTKKNSLAVKTQFDDRDKLCDIVCVPLIEMDRPFSVGMGYTSMNKRVLFEVCVCVSDIHPVNVCETCVHF